MFLVSVEIIKIHNLKLTDMFKFDYTQQNNASKSILYKIDRQELPSIIDS